MLYGNHLNVISILCVQRNQKRENLLNCQKLVVLGVRILYELLVISFYNCILTFNVQFMFKATYIYSVFQYQACVYRTQAQYDRSHVLLTEMLQTEAARAIYLWNVYPPIWIHMSVFTLKLLKSYSHMNSHVRFHP